MTKISIEFEYEEKNSSSWTIEIKICVLTDDMVL